jgi:hypothetical protein
MGSGKATGRHDETASDRLGKVSIPAPSSSHSLPRWRSYCDGVVTVTQTERDYLFQYNGLRTSRTALSQQSSPHRALLVTRPDMLSGAILPRPEPA